MGRKSDIIDQAINNVSNAGEKDILTQKRLDFILEQLNDGKSYSQTFSEYNDELATESESQAPSESYQAAVTEADNFIDLSNDDFNFETEMTK